MSSFGHFASQFQIGFGIIIFRIFSSGLTALQHERVGYLFKAILLTFIVLYSITIPSRIALVILQYITWRLSFVKLSTILMKQRLSMTFVNVFMDAVWYIPFIVLFLSRSLGLFPSTPFDKVIMDKNESFGLQLLDARTKQTAFTGATYLLKRITILLLVSVLTFTSRLVPGIRILLALSIITFVQLRRAIYKIQSKTDGASITLYALSLSMLVSNTFVQLLLTGAKLYLTSQTLSREFLFPYFCKVSFKMEERDRKTYASLLFGFGCAMSLFFAIPVFGLILYPVFQMAAVDILLVMLDQNNLSFTTTRPPMQPPAQRVNVIQKLPIAPLVKGGPSPPRKRKRSVPLITSNTEIYATVDHSAKDGLEDMLNDMLCVVEDTDLKEQEKKPSKKKKKKKKKAPVLYSEDATRLFKKMSDGKRFKNGIALRKTCNIFSVAWELPDENGRVLPSKVARHFKQVLPSKKAASAKKMKKTASKVKRSGGASPIPLMQSTVSNEVDYGSVGLGRAQTVRGHMHTKQTFLEADDDMKTHQWRRSAHQLPMASELDIPDASELGQQKKSMVSTLESLIAADPNRTQADDVEVNVIHYKPKRAGSMTDLDFDKMNDSMDQLVVQNEVEQMIEAKKKSKLKTQAQPQEPKVVVPETYFD